MESQHCKNIQKWLRYIEANKLKKRDLWVPIDIFRYKIGIETPPVVFWSFKAITFDSGIVNSILFALIGYIFLYPHTYLPLGVFVLIHLAFGFTISLLMAWMVMRQRGRLGLSTWDAFLAEHDEKAQSHSLSES